jgi:hypothetical protein
MSRRRGRIRTSLARLLKSDDESQSGATIVLVALVMTLLVAFAAFAVDYGWLYLNGIRIQHGADAAAMAGVIYEPGDQTMAYGEAEDSARENGYVDGPGTTVTPVDFSDDPAAVQNQFQLAVTIEDEVETFFMRIFGFDSISMTKKAVAEYVLPLPMGSDLPYFGTDPSDPARQPNFWGNIHGYYTGRRMGDRYSSQCVDGGSTSTCTRNDDRRQTTYGGDGKPVSGGYLYGVEVPAGASGDLTVEIFDGPFYQGGHDRILVGDQPQGGSDGPNTWYILYAPDPTPLNTSDNIRLCTWQATPQMHPIDFDNDGDIGNWSGGAWNQDLDDDLDGDGDVDWDDFSDPASGYPGGVNDLWHTLCSVPAAEGVYPLRVVTDDPGSSDERGLNRYSMRASTSGNQPRFYGLGDMAVYVNFSGSSATFNLAEVQPVHAGKQLVIELWDPDSGNNGVEIRLPDGSLPQCSWHNLDDSRGQDNIPCDINFSTGFDNDHMQIRIDIDSGYTCTTDCWWTIEVNYPTGANDTTTWSSRIEGNPVKLVE